VILTSERPQKTQLFLGAATTKAFHCDSSRSTSKLMACRVADACDHAEHTAQPEIGAAIQPARLPSTRSGWVELPLAF